jgi:tRNA(adenine34) deaminase
MHLPDDPYATPNDELDRQFMRQAFREAERAYDADEVPVGAVVVHENRIIGRGHNHIQRLKDPTAHAEMIAITAAAEYLGQKRLVDCSLYVTLEPCAMCSGAIVLARIARLVYGASDPKTGASGSLYDITNDSRLNHQCLITTGVMADESAALLKAFFAKLRGVN